MYYVSESKNLVSQVKTYVSKRKTLVIEVQT